MKNKRKQNVYIGQKPFPIIVPFICMMIVGIIITTQGCTKIIKEPLHLSSILEENSLVAPYIGVKDHTLCIIDADQEHSFPLQELPSASIQTSKPIYREDVAYFGLWDTNDSSTWSSVWKYSVSSQEISLLWETNDKDYRLINIDPMERYLCMRNTDPTDPTIHFYDTSSSTMIETIMDKKRSLDLCFFGKDPSTVILGQSIDEVPEHYFFFVWTIGSSDRLYEIGRGVNPAMNESGTLFHYCTVQPPSLVFYSLESKERMSFRQQTNKIQWDFWTDDTLFLAEKYTPDDTMPRFYRLNMRGEKEPLSGPIPQNEGDIWYVGMDQECPIVYIQNDTMTGFMKFNDSGEWLRYAPLAEFSTKKDISYVSEFVPIAQRNQSPYTTKNTPGQFFAFLVEMQDDQSSDESIKLKTMQFTVFRPSKTILTDVDDNLQLVQYTMENFHHSLQESMISLSPYENGDVYNIQYYAREHSGENRPILISLTLGSSMSNFEEILHYTSLVYTEDQVPRFHPLSIDPSGRIAYGWINFVDPDGNTIMRERNNVFFPLLTEKSLELHEIFSLTDSTIQFISWVFPAIE